jgi:dienelactone hydrolase
MASFARRFFVAALLVLELAYVSPAAADQLVKFAAASPLSQAVTGGAGLPVNGTGIEGYLTKPRGNGPFPAAVMLHSCLGLRADRQSVASRLAGWGYVTLFVDDFSTRGLKETCAVDFPEGLSDAFGALAFVAKLPYVDKARIVAVGYSQGAATALQIAALGATSRFALPGGPKFKTVAAFYPGCAGLPGARLQIPTLILIGSADTVTPAADCEQLARRQPAGQVKLMVYSAAGHVFDDPAFAGGKQLLGMWLQFDPNAATQSQSALRDFLAATLAR